MTSCQIVKREIPSTKIYEDKDTYAFLDINPVNPGHTLVVSKTCSRNIFDIEEHDLAKLISAVKKIALAVKEGTGAGGVNIQLNNESSAGQVVFHTHFHIVPRFDNDGLHLWPGRKYQPTQADSIRNKISSVLNLTLLKD